MYIELLILLAVFFGGTYVIWPSRYNIPAHMSLAMAGVAYVIPTLILPEIISVYDTNIIELYENILLLGGVFYLLGMFVGYRSRMSLRRKGFLWENISTDSYCKKVSRLTIGLTQFAILGIILCFLAMGFVPLFAEDPIAAKFFREAYQDSYKKVAGLYRTCNYILQFTIPILVVLWFYYRKRIYILFCIYSLIILMGCVARSPAFSGLLVGIGIIVAYKKTLFKYYIFLLFLIYGIGSSFFYILGFSSYGLDSTASIFEIMINGAPDISDHLMFLTAFSDHPEHTYGRTFWGGLIPNHYYWNPSVWTLHVVNGGDINNIISGGLRLPLPIWGYVSFSWPGVVLLSGCVGFLSGKFIKKTKYMLDRGGGILIKAIILMVYIKVYLFFTNFHVMKIYDIPVLFLMILYLYNIKVGKSRPVAISETRL